MTTPVLCVNCGKAFVDHSQDILGSCGPGVTTLWRDPSELLKLVNPTVIEQRAAEQIAVWVEKNYGYSKCANAIRSGAWRKSNG